MKRIVSVVLLVLAGLAGPANAQAELLRFDGVILHPEQPTLVHLDRPGRCGATEEWVDITGGPLVISVKFAGSDALPVERQRARLFCWTATSHWNLPLAVDWREDFWTPEKYLRETTAPAQMRRPVSLEDRTSHLGW
ncbi:MAG: hypothetical protein AAGC55_21990, partial [Myxococcota bacterium]